MADSTLNRFVSAGTAAARAAYTPTPPTPSSGPTPGYFWHETDTGDTYSWKAGTGWIKVNSAGVADGDKGDITVSSSGAAWAIDNDVVTYAKMQNASATARVLARKTAGSGDYEECTVAEVLNFIASSAQGDVMIRDGTGWTRLAAGTSGQFLKTQGAAANPVWASAAGTGALLGRQIITATGAGTYTPTAGTGSVIIEMVGGGGGGAGVASPGTGAGTRGSSGGGGAYVRKRLTANFSGASYSVGAKGSGGSSGLNNGANGSDTTFTDTAGSPTTYTAGGGVGGVAAAGTTSNPSMSGRAAGGTATNGDINLPGGASQPGVLLTSTGAGISGNGGTSEYSPGGASIASNTSNASTAGNNAGGYGGGGSAAYVQGTGTAQAGGNGADGIIIIWEFS